MSNGEIEQTMREAERRAQLGRMRQTLSDPWAWAFAVLVTADVAARLFLLSFVVWATHAVAFVWLPTWLVVLLLVWALAPVLYVFQDARIRKRLIRLEAVQGVDE